jgi:hypothetical protein
MFPAPSSDEPGTRKSEIRFHRSGQETGQEAQTSKNSILGRSFESIAITPVNHTTARNFQPLRSCNSPANAGEQYSRNIPVPMNATR